MLYHRILFSKLGKFFKMSGSLIEIDGGIMEGGGQIVRIATALSVLLKKPIKISNIRAGRKNPGLRPQHLAGLELVRDICNGKLLGGEIGSTEISFYPDEIQSGTFTADPGTAGSVMLLFQIAFPSLLFAPDSIKLFLKGGTNAEMAPQIDHTLMVFQPIIERFGIKFQCNIIRRGYYPKGGGEIVINSSPIKDCLNAIELLDPGTVQEIHGRSFVAGVLPIKMAHLMADLASQTLRPKFSNIPVKIERIKEPSHLAFGNGSGIVLVAKTSTGCLFGGSALGKREMRADAVGEMAAKDLVADIDSGGCVDSFIQDQLIIFMAIAKGRSRLRTGKLTLHTETAIHITEKLTGVKFNIEKKEESGYCIIECDGLALKR